MYTSSSHELLNEAFSPMGGPTCPHKKNKERLRILIFKNLVLTLPSRSKTLVIIAKSYTETDIKVSFLVPSNFTWFLYFIPLIFPLTVFVNKFFLITHPNPFQTSILWYFYNFSASLIILIQIETDKVLEKLQN